MLSRQKIIVEPISCVESRDFMTRFETLFAFNVDRTALQLDDDFPEAIAIVQCHFVANKWLLHQGISCLLILIGYRDERYFSVVISFYDISFGNEYPRFRRSRGRSAVDVADK